MIWPFPTRGARGAGPLPDFGEVPNFAQFLNNDAVLKVWLPERLSTRLDWLSQSLGSSRPDVVRGLLFEHVYGRVAMYQLQEFARHLELSKPQFSRKQTGGDDDVEQPKFSRARSVNIAMLGKAGDDFKLFLPGKLKQAVVELAELHSLTPSTYTRKALVLEVLGERFHTQWQAALGKLGNPPPDLDKLERD